MADMFVRRTVIFASKRLQCFTMQQKRLQRKGAQKEGIVFLLKINPFLGGGLENP